MCLGIRVLTTEEGIYKYGKGEGKGGPCGDGLEFKVSV